MEERYNGVKFKAPFLLADSLQRVMLPCAKSPLLEPPQSVAIYFMKSWMNTLGNLRSSLGRHAVKWVLAGAAMTSFGSAGAAASLPLQYRGLIEMDYGSSIVGLPRYSRYWVDFSLDGSIVDTQHTAFQNAFENAYGVKGITALGSYPPPFLNLKFTADSSNGLAPLDLSGLTFAYSDAGGSGVTVVDANQPPDPQIYPCDTAPCHNEHVTLSIRDLTPGAPVEVVWFNLYNSNFYEPPYASRQLILDTSTPDNGFRFVDLFLKGPSTLAEFKSYRKPDFTALIDGVLFEGPNGTLASGRFLSLEFVPPACPASVPVNDVISGAFTACTLGDKQFSNFTGLEELGGSTSQLHFVSTSPAEYVLTWDNFDGSGVTTGFNFSFTASVVSGAELINGVDYAVYTADTAYADFGYTTNPTPFPPPVTSLVISPYGAPTSLGVGKIELVVKQTPAPLPIFGAAAAFGFTRRLRSRILSGRINGAGSQAWPPS